MVNPNGQYYPGKTTESSPMHDYEVYRPGIPLKLELASRFMAGMMANQYLADQDFSKLAEYATNAADALIECFNNQQKDTNNA